MEVLIVFLFLGSKITAESDCSHEIRRGLILDKKEMANINSVLKSRNITLLTKVKVKAMSQWSGYVPVVRYGCESWTRRKAEHERFDAFKLWCLRRLLRAPWTASRSNQSIFREINTEYSLEGLRLKLKLQYIGHLMQTDDSLEESLMLGKIEGRRRRECQSMR